MNKTLMALSIIGLATMGCSSEHEASDADQPHKASMEKHDDGHSHAVHWSYKGEGEPGKWGSLKSEYATCGTGKEQSPIDIASEGAKTGPAAPIEFNYGKSTLNIVNNGHTIQVNYDAGSTATIRGKKYDLLQFHFHSPSEHMIDGKPANLVAHLVHKAEDGQLAVVGVLFNKGTENAALQAIWDKMPISEGKVSDAAEIDVNAFLPEDKSYFHYMGSLTTPPCSENVNWNVMKNPVSVSDAQTNAFAAIFPLSVRPVQPLNTREVAAM